MDEYSKYSENNPQNTQNPYGQPYTYGPQHQPYQSSQSAQYSYGGPENQIPYTVKPVKHEKKEHPFLKKTAKLIISAAVFGLVASAVFFGSNRLYYLLNPAAEQQNNIDISAGNSKLNLDPVSDKDKQLPSTIVSNNVTATASDVSAIVAATEPSIVSIKSTINTQSFYGTYQQTGGGSGIIIDMTDNELMIATNSHVVEGAVSIQVVFADGSTATALIKGTDPTADLAVISISLDDLSNETKAAIKVATLGDSDSVKVGQRAIAIGNALGYGQSTTVGYIGAVDREVTVDGNTMSLLQTDAAINPGNSGGALLNLKGEVIGINTVKYASEKVEGMGFAIPISRAVSILNELKNREILTDEEKGFLGIYPENVTSAMAQAYNWPVGVYVNRLSEGGSAEQSGIHVGDIITAVNGVSITTGTQLRDYVNSYRIGNVVKVTLQRLTNGAFTEMEIDVTLMANPDAVTQNTPTPDLNNVN